MTSYNERALEDLDEPMRGVVLCLVRTLEDAYPAPIQFCGDRASINVGRIALALFAERHPGRPLIIGIGGGASCRIPPGCPWTEISAENDI